MIELEEEWQSVLCCERATSTGSTTSFLLREEGRDGYYRNRVKPKPVPQGRRMGGGERGDTRGRSAKTGRSPAPPEPRRRGGRRGKK